MKNVKLFCQMAMHIKTVKECNSSLSGLFSSHVGYPVCLIGEAKRAKLLPKNERSFNLGLATCKEEPWAVLFNVIPPREVIFPERSSARVETFPGTVYYDVCVKFLRKHKCLQVLPRMENQAKAA